MNWGLGWRGWFLAFPSGTNVGKWHSNEAPLFFSGRFVSDAIVVYSMWCYFQNMKVGMLFFQDVIIWMKNKFCHSFNSFFFQIPKPPWSVYFLCLCVAWFWCVRFVIVLCAFSSSSLPVLKNRNQVHDIEKHKWWTRKAVRTPSPFALQMHTRSQIPVSPISTIPGALLQSISINSNVTLVSNLVI